MARRHLIYRVTQQVFEFECKISYFEPHRLTEFDEDINVAVRTSLVPSK